MQNTDLVPRWLTERYILLKKTVGTNPFTFETAYKVLKNSPKKDEEKIVRLCLSELRKNGWLSVDVDHQSTDSRMRIYTLKEPDAIFNEMSKNIVRILKEDKNESRT